MNLCNFQLYVTMQFHNEVNFACEVDSIISLVIKIRCLMYKYENHNIISPY